MTENVTYSMPARVHEFLVKLHWDRRTWVYAHWIRSLNYGPELRQAIELGLVKVSEATCGENKGRLFITDRGNAWVQMHLTK